MSRRQAGVLEELQEWLEDVRERGIRSRVILLAAPSGLGRSAVLARFREWVAGPDGPVAALVTIDGGHPGDRAVQAGAVARAARAVAAVSVKLPVVVVIDDAGLLDAGLARAMITGLAARFDGRILVVAAASPGSELVKGLARDPGHDPGRARPPGRGGPADGLRRAGGAGAGAAAAPAG
jgi:hypothetical protein